MHVATPDHDPIATIRRLSAPLAPLPADTPSRLAPMAGLRAVLFDVYGTLFVSGSGDVGTAAAMDSATALGEALAETGLGADGEAGPRGVALLQAAIAAHHAARRSEGIPHPEVEIRDVWEEVLSTLAGEGRLSRPPDGGACARLAVAYECRVNPVWPMPGARDTLQVLRGRGLHLGIVSNAQFYTPLLFRALLDASPQDLGFAPALCAWSYEHRVAKPSPHLFAGVLAGLAAQHGIRPEETAYVGNDCLNDIWTARRAGCRTVLFAGDARSLRWRHEDARCRDLEPDAIVTALMELPGILCP